MSHLVRLITLGMMIEWGELLLSVSDHMIPFLAIGAGCFFVTMRWIIKELDKAATIC